MTAEKKKYVGQHGGRQGGRQKKERTKLADMELDMVADKEVVKVANMVVVHLISTFIFPYFHLGSVL